jgi:hypothetical protein
MAMIPKAGLDSSYNWLSLLNHENVEDLVSSMKNLNLCELQRDIEDDKFDLQDQDITISQILSFADGDIRKLPKKLAQKITDAMPSVNCLELIHIEKLTKEALGLVTSQFENLDSLRLNHSILPPNTPAMLGFCTNLVYLDLSHCRTVNDMVIHEVSISCQKLIDLRLRGTKISDKALASLSDLAELECLDLSHTPITDGGLSTLQSSSLIELRMNGCHTRRSDCLTTYMPFNKKITPTGLLYNPIRLGITDKGFLTVVKNVESLRKVDIFDTHITDRVIRKAKKFSRQERSKILTVCNFRTHMYKDGEKNIVIGPVSFEIARPKPPATVINRSEAYAILRGEDFSNWEFVSNVLNLAKGNIVPLLRVLQEEMATAAKIESLQLKDCLMTREKLLKISTHFENLHSLSFCNVHITDFMALTSFKKLTDLNLSHYPYSDLNTIEFVNAITGCAWLENLDLSFTDIGEQAFCAIIARKYFKNIDITGCANISRDAVEDAREQFEGDLNLKYSSVDEYKQPSEAHSATAADASVDEAATVSFQISVQCLTGLD